MRSLKITIFPASYPLNSEGWVNAPTGPWKYRARGNLAYTARFPHSHRPGLHRAENWKTTFPRAQATTVSLSPTKKERKSAAARPPHPDLFQDHVALETLSRFRIIR